MNRTNDVSNQDDIIDSRDVISRIEEIEAELQDEDLCEDVEAYREELATLRDLAKEGEGFSDWEYGATLIRDSYFEDYAQELAEDMGLTDSTTAWPHYCIDWERAARDLQTDYCAIEFDGVTYWIR